MKEAQFLGTLIPSHRDFKAIIQQLRQKYQLREVDPDGEPITEIYKTKATENVSPFYFEERQVNLYIIFQ